MNGDFDISLTQKVPESQGRPRKSWEELGDCNKTAKVAEVSSNPPDALAKAAYKVQIESGNADSSFVSVKSSAISIISTTKPKT